MADFGVAQTQAVKAAVPPPAKVITKRMGSCMDDTHRRLFVDKMYPFKTKRSKQQFREQPTLSRCMDNTQKRLFVDKLEFISPFFYVFYFRMGKLPHRPARIISRA